MPSVAFIGGKLTRTRWWGPLCSLDVTKVLWGLLCGVGVASGYAAYFTSSAHISPTIAFGIVCCNPLLALVIDILRCEFRGSSTTLKVYLALSLVSYGAAIAMLASIPSHASSRADGSGSGS